MRNLSYNVTHSVVPTLSPKVTCFSAVLSTTYTKALTSNITTMPVISSYIIFQQIGYFENSTISAALKGQSLHAFRYLNKFQAWKMTTSKVVHFVLKLPFTFLLLQLAGDLQSDSMATVTKKRIDCKRRRKSYMGTTNRKWKRETRPASGVWFRKLYDLKDMGK